MQLSKIYKLIPSVQNYSWGRVGDNSLLAAFLESVDANKPYAELWFGAHKKAPAQVLLADQLISLDQLVETRAEEILGQGPARKFSNRLPFLFKLLSIAKPLSIQAHPDKTLAAELHFADPRNYPDDKEKLELAVALSEVELLHGFKKKKEVSFFVSNRKAFRELIGSSALENFDSKEGIKIIYQSLMSSSPSKLESAITALILELEVLVDKKPEDEWIFKLATESRVDAGIFGFYLLNLFKIKPGQAFYTKSGVPHAYLSGDLAECMTNSDNVVRGGLTTKYQDINTFLSMLDYKESLPEVIENFCEFVCPSGEFKLEVISAGNSFRKLSSVELVVCISGSGQMIYSGSLQKISAGESYLIPACLGAYELRLESGQVFISSTPRLDI